MNLMERSSTLAGGFVIQFDHLLKTSCRRSFLFCLCDLSWSKFVHLPDLGNQLRECPCHLSKEKKFACDFDFSDVVTCGVAVTLYGQTCIYIYMRIIYTIFVCIYAFVLLAENIYSAVLNLYTGCFAVYAKRIRLISLKKIASYL